jgi:hypothetical protein
MKTCSRCKVEKDTSFFGKSACNKDGFQFYCRECRKLVCHLSFKRTSEEQLEKRKAATKKWRQENKHLVQAYSKEYAAANLPKRLVLQKKRECSKMNRTPAWLTEEDNTHIKCLYSLAAMRNKYSGEKWHVDHIIPLQGKLVSGLHVPLNLKVVTATYNSRKYNTYEIQ